MHKKYRGPINKKHLIISLVGVLLFAIILSFFTLKSTPSNTTTKTSTTEYKTIKKSLDNKFNQNGKVVTIKEDHNINDDTSKHPHTVIVIRLTDKQTQKYLKTSFEAIQNNQATDDQKSYVRALQNIVATQAKKLDNNYDVIQFVYKDGKTFVPVASSQKNRNLIKLVKTK